jgi:hypothetical protein
MGKPTYMNFVELETDKKTRVICVFNNAGVQLGIISFYPAWRQYIFRPREGTMFSSGCERDLADFKDRLTLEWRTKQNVRTEKIQNK